MNKSRSFRQRGAHTVAFLVAVVTLFFSMGLGIDAGRLWVAKSEMQNAADACALAAASALNGAIDLQVAEDLGMTVGARNQVDFQTKNITFNVNSSVRFSATLNGVYQPKSLVANPGDMKYVRCTIDSPAVSYFLFRVVNIIAPGTVGTKVVGSTAVATLEPSITSCAIPIGACAKGSDANLNQPNWGWTVGDWMTARLSPGSGWTGAFRWVEFPGYEKTPDLRDLLEGSGQCGITGTPTTVDSHNGQIQSLIEPWNWRFGVKKNSGQTVPADFSGFSYTDATTAAGGTPTWPSGSNAYDDFVTNKRPVNTPWNGSPALSGGWQASSQAFHQTGADRRFVTIPVVECPGLGAGPGSGSSPVYGFACVMLLNPVDSPQQDMGMEFRGDVANPLGLTGCSTSGLPGTGVGPEVPGLVY